MPKHPQDFRVLVVYPELIGMLVLPLSVGLFTALLRRAGYTVALFDTAHYVTDETTSPTNRVKFLQARPFEYERDLRVMWKTDLHGDFRRTVLDFRPHLLVVTTVEDTWLQAVSLLDCVDDLGIPSICGGVFVTAAPEKAIRFPAIRMVGIGEGEAIVPQVAERIRSGASCEGIPGVWVKGEDGTIHRTPRGPVVDIDRLPVPDFSLFEESRFYRPMGGKVHRTIPIETMRGCSYACVSSSELIGTEHFLLRPDEFMWNGTDICPAGHTHRLARMGNVTAVSNGRKPFLWLTLENGLGMAVSREHPVAAVRNDGIEYIPAQELTVGSWLATHLGQCSVTKPVNLTTPTLPHRTQTETAWAQIRRVPTSLGEPLAWLIGLLLGDGHIRKMPYAQIHFAINARTHDTFCDYFESLFGVQPRFTASTITKKMVHCWVTSRYLYDFFVQSLGINPSDKLHVPQGIRRSPKSIALAFLDGLMAADGYWPKSDTYKHPYLTTISRRFAMDVAALSIWAGRPASIVRGSKTPQGRQAWRVYFCYENCWGRVYGKPCPTNRIPVVGRTIYRSRKSGKLFWRTGELTRLGVPRERLRELDSTHPLLNNAFIYTRILSVSDRPKDDAYDLCVEPSHTFSINGIQVENCSFCNSPGQVVMASDAGSGAFVRRKHVAVLEKELTELAGRYAPELLYFVDDIFLGKPLTWLEEFAEMYQQFGIRYWHNSRPESITPKTLGLLRDTNCYRMSLGLEAGNEVYRDKALHRKMRNDKLTTHFTYAANGGVVYSMNLILGYPDETREMVFETVELVRQLPGYDSLTVSIFTPYHGTGLRRIAEERGYLDPSVITTHTTSSSLLTMPRPYLSRDEIDQLMRTIPLYVHLDKARWPEIGQAETNDRLFAQLQEEYRGSVWGDQEDRGGMP